MPLFTKPLNAVRSTLGYAKSAAGKAQSVASSAKVASGRTLNTIKILGNQSKTAAEGFLGLTSLIGPRNMAEAAGRTMLDVAREGITGRRGAAPFVGMGIGAAAGAYSASRSDDGFFGGSAKVLGGAALGFGGGLAYPGAKAASARAWKTAGRMGKTKFRSRAAGPTLHPRTNMPRPAPNQGGAAYNGMTGRFE